MKWNFDNERAIYSQIVEQIKLFIISGYYEKGSKLPSVRDLAEEAKVNPNTMQKALAELERQGLIYSNRTTGNFITDDENLIKNVKKEFADDKIREFISYMKNLGYDKQDTVKLLENYETGGNENE
ncbi:MAG: GntR family transcriptional regulator [Bacillota bacterium]|nr:GntR family transcriptional regulator [Bacillota bacterium]